MTASEPLPGQPFEFVAAGEILVDLVAADRQLPLREVRSFLKLFGGAPANVAANLQRLGVRSTIVSRVGNDGLGTFLIDALAALGVDGRHVTRDPHLPTSLVVVTSGRTPPEFVAYRQADTQLQPADLPDSLLAGCRVFHTTAHGIARQPTRQTVLEAFRRVHALGRWTSFDPNYSPTFWPDREEALAVLREFLACTTFCKPSLDDCERLFGPRSVDQFLDRLHDWGAERVLLTKGAEGAVFSRCDGGRRSYPALVPPALVDTTGAGDAFTAGFLAAYLRTGDEDRAMRAGLRTASIKIQHLGAIAPLPSLEEILASSGPA